MVVRTKIYKEKSTNLIDFVFNMKDVVCFFPHYESNLSGNSKPTGLIIVHFNNGFSPVVNITFDTFYSMYKDYYNVLNK